MVKPPLVGLRDIHGALVFTMWRDKEPSISWNFAGTTSRSIGVDCIEKYVRPFSARQDRTVLGKHNDG